MSEYIMNRESLKKHCESMCKKFKDVPTSGTYSEHRFVLDLLEQSEWIPVSERLPKENGYYLTTTMYHEVYCDYWEEERFNRTEAVIAWMPLPEPYKAESEE